MRPRLMRCRRRVDKRLRGGTQAPFLPIFSRAMARRPVRHASEQNRTSSQLAAHFRRQVNGRPQAAQIFSGRLAFLCATMGVPLMRQGHVAQHSSGLRVHQHHPVRAAAL